MRLLVAVLMAWVFFVDAAMACRNPASNTMTLLRKLPGDALKEALVAKVDVIEILNDSEAKIKVIESIKGAHSEQILKLNTGGSSCDQHLRHYNIGEKFYISGRLIKLPGQSAQSESMFFGRWPYERAAN